MDLITILAFFAFGFFIFFVAFLFISDGDMSLIFLDKFGKKLGRKNCDLRENFIFASRNLYVM
jgi:hypothetical protein